MGKDENTARNRRSLSPVLLSSHGSVPPAGGPSTPAPCPWDSRASATPGSCRQPPLPTLFQNPAARPPPTSLLRASPSSLGAPPCPPPPCHCPPRHWTKRTATRKTSSSSRGAVARGADPSLPCCLGDSPVVPLLFPSKPPPTATWLGSGSRSGPGLAHCLEALSVGLAVVPG